MTAQEAVALVDQAVAQLGANRETHVRLQEAIRTLGLTVEAATTLAQELSAAKEKIAGLELELANATHDLDLTAAPPTEAPPS